MIDLYKALAKTVHRVAYKQNLLLKAIKELLRRRPVESPSELSYLQSVLQAPEQECIILLSEAKELPEKVP